MKKFYERQALNALGVQDYEKAMQYFRKIMEAFPTERGVHYNYAVSLIGLKQYSEAQIHLIRELEISGERYEVLVTLGELYYLSKNRTKALTYLKMALEHCVDEKAARVIRKKISTARDPSQYERMLTGYATFEKGVDLLNAGSWEKAQHLFLEALKHDDANPMIYNNLGVIALNYEKDYAQAREYFEQALTYSDLPIIRKNFERTLFYQHRNSSKKT
ncbi:MAG: tetratricopeptide repeat protein [Desulfomonilia bacterium]